MNNPQVSVIIPTFKRISKLKKAVENILLQSYKNLEIIIINDDPKTNIEKYLPKRNNIIIINHDENKGGSAARNTGIFNSTGKYLAFMDDDDIFLPNKIEKLVNIMETLSDNWVGIYSWWILKNNRRIQSSEIEGDISYPLLSMDKEFSLGGSSSLFLRTKPVKEINGFDESYERHQEWEFLLRLMKVGKLKLFREGLFIKEKSHNISPDKYLNIKFKFLKDFNNKILSFGFKKSKKIYACQLSHVLFKYLNNKNWQKGFKIIKKIFLLSPMETVKQLIIYFKNKLYNSIF